MLARPIGRKNFQARPMSWSTRKRGRVPRNHTITKNNAYVLDRNQIQDGIGSPRQSTPAATNATAPMPRTGTGSFDAPPTSQASVSASSQNGMAGPCQPPRNNVTVKAQTVNDSRNSAMYHSANFMPLYSVWNPATSSDSASGM